MVIFLPDSLYANSVLRYAIAPSWSKLFLKFVANNGRVHLQVRNHQAWRYHPEINVDTGVVSYPNEWYFLFGLPWFVGLFSEYYREHCAQSQDL
jgi:hypothetical protein